MLQALRSLQRKPVFAISVVSLFALGIGVTSSIFALIDAVLLRPLPFPESDRLVAISQSKPSEKMVDSPVSAWQLDEWTKTVPGFTGAAGYYSDSATETSGQLPERILVAQVTTRFFTTLGASAQVGRTFTTDEERSGGLDAVVLSHGYWQRKFAGDPNIAGKQVRFGSASAVIVGVMPPSFSMPDNQTDLWRTTTLSAEVTRTGRFFTGFARLAKGTTLAQAQAAIEVAQLQFAGQFPAEEAGWRPQLRDLKESAVGTSSNRLLLLMGAVSLVLLIASANIASLMLVRGEERAREIAIRSTLGAGRRSLIRLLLGEAAILSLAGASLGLLLALWTSEWLARVIQDLPRASEVRVDFRIILFALATSALATLVSSLVPALLSTRRDIAGALLHGSKGTTRGAGGLQAWLVGAQVALSIVLLSGAALMVRSFLALSSVAPGFEPERVLTLRISGNWGESMQQERVRARMSKTIATLEAVPGVESAGIATWMPVASPIATGPMTINGRDRDAQNNPITATGLSATAGFFNTLRIPLVAGERCRDNKNEALINQTFQERFGQGASLVGATLGYGPAGNARIVGIVADSHNEPVNKSIPPTTYFCDVPGFYPDPYYFVRTKIDPAAMTPAIRAAIASILPNRGVYSTLTMNERLRQSSQSTRFQTLLMTLFGGLTIPLAALGLFGILSYFVAGRTREIGLRIAIGAEPRDVFALVASRGALIVLGGLVSGSVAALALSRFLAGFLYGISPTDWLSYAAAIGTLLVASAVACVLPAWRAVRITPTEALRQD